MLQRLLERTIQSGQLTLAMPDGRQMCFGAGSPSVVWKINDAKVPSRIFRNREYEVGETYVEGGWDVLEGELIDLFHILFSNLQKRRPGYWSKLVSRAFKQWNHLHKSLINVSRHYDLDEKLFRSFLDSDMHYSCAYFESERDDLESAQRNKCRHIMKKLLLHPGHRVLDIGCGWGGMAFYLATHSDVHVTGITLSEEQCNAAIRESESRRLTQQVGFKLEDYREHRELYDRIVSVGMFEHVGQPYYDVFFRSLKRLLQDDGVALLHTIGRTSEPGITNPWIEQHIFPGGYIPALSEVVAAIEKRGLIITDIECLRLHYAETLAHWSRRFRQHRPQIVADRGERFCRMWEFYLAVSEAAFRYDDLVVYQLQLAKNKAVVPDTRNYLY